MDATPDAGNDRESSNRPEAEAPGTIDGPQDATVSPAEAGQPDSREPRGGTGRSPPKPKPDVAQMLTSVADENIDAEVEAAMTGITEADMTAATGDQVPNDAIEPGSLVSGRVANIGSDDILVDFGAKTLGAMPLAELRKEEQLRLGDRIQVCVMGEDRRTGLLKVSMKEARRQVLLRDMKVGLIVEGKVSGMNKGGLDLDIDGVRAFIPASQVDLHFMKDISDLIGQTIRAEVVQFDKDSGDMVVSRRKAQMKEQAARKDQVFAELEVGQVRRGTVRSVTDYGAFVDIGGVDGLLHVSDMSWGRVAKPEDLVKVGDELEVKILKLQADQKKVSLGLKQITTNPWETAGDKFTVGTNRTGRVVRLASFGAFVELEPGVDGLLPVSEMSWTRRIRHPSEVVKEGDVVEVALLSVDIKKKRISLSLKQLREDPWTAASAKYAAGSMIQGKVVRTTDFGAFVELEDGIDGLIHISELADERTKAVTDRVKPGQAVEVRVLGVDSEAKRISLSMRKPPAEPSPEELAAAAAQRAAAEKKRKSRPQRGGITFGWDSDGLGQLDPSKFGK